MSSPITGVAQTQAADQATAVRPKASESKPQQIPTDTVHISSAAKAALQEALETHAQTVQEATGGDNQARRLLAKEAAAAKVPKS